MVVITMGGVFIWFLHYYYMESLQSSMLIQSRIMAELALKIISEDNYETKIQSLCDRLGNELGVRFTIINHDGVVLGDSGEDPRNMDNHLDRPEVKEALTSEEGYSARYSDTYGEDLFYVAVPIGDEPGYSRGGEGEREGVGNGNIRGVVRLALPLTGIKQAIFRLQGFVVAALIISGLSAVTLGVLLSNKIINPIRNIRMLAGNIAAGRFDSLPEKEDMGKDEIADLNRTLMRTGRALEEQMNRLMIEKNRLETVLYSMSAGIILVNHKLNIEIINPGAEELLGVKRDKATGEPLLSILRFNLLYENINAVINDGHSRNFEMSIFFPEIRIVQASLIPVTGEYGHLESILALFHDITFLRSMEKMRSEFAANVSHELRTPLTTISGYTETILTRKGLGREHLDEFLEIIARETRRLSVLVDSLLDLSRIEEQKGIVKKQVINFKNIIRQVVREMNETARRKRVSLEIDMPDDDVYIQGNPEWLRQVVFNILENAINYNHQNGTVWVRVLLNPGSGTGRMTFEVEDNGPGIPRLDLPRVFERFYRVDKARSKKLGGTGLGLSIVKHILDAHGAEYSLHSEENKGTVFRFTLPLQVI